MHHATTSDRDLVELVLGGQRDAFTALTERYIGAANAVARARLGRATETEDAVQEAFLRAFERLGTLRDPAKFGPWLLTIARHEAVRLAAQRAKSNTLDESVNGGVAHSPDVEQREMNALLRNHIMQLPEPSREVLLLHYFAGKSAREIATLLELRRNAVLKRLQRAREQLAETLLVELESTRPTRDSLAKQAARIAALTTAAAIPAATATTASAVGASWAGAFVTASAAATVMAIGAVLYFAGNPQGSALSGSDTSLRSSGSVLAATTRGPDDAPESSPPSVALAAAESQQPESVGGSPDGIESLMAQAPDPGPRPAGNLDEMLGQLVTFEFENEHVARLLETITESTGVEFLIDTRAVGLPVYGPQQELPRVPYATEGMLEEVTVDDVPLTEALQLIAQELGLQAVLEPGYVWISTPTNIAREVRTQPRERFEAYDVEEILESRVTLHFRDQHVGEILEFIHGTYDLNLAYDPRVVAPSGGPKSHSRYPDGKVTDGTIALVIFKDIVLRDSVTALCRMLNVEPVFDRDYVWLSSRDQIHRDGLRDAPPSDRERIERLLNAKTSVIFEDIAFAEIAGFLFDIFKLRLVLDQRVTYWPEEPASARPLRAEAASTALTHGMMMSVGGSETPLRVFLELNLRHLGLACYPQGDLLIVTRLTEARDQRVPQEFLVEPKAYPAVVVPEPAGAEAQNSPQSNNPEAPPLQLLSIQEVAGGGHRAQIESAGSVKFYSEGDAFLQYKLLSIDPASGFVTILDERTNENILLSEDRYVRIQRD